MSAILSSSVHRMMKAQVLLAVTAVLVALVPAVAQAQAKPDLRISSIRTPGGLCAGNENKVQVTVTNGSMAAVNQPISVILFVSQAGQQPTSYVGTLDAGIGPNDNYGKPVWFHNVVVPATGKVTLKATIPADQGILESNFGNNDRIQNANVTRVCGAAPPPPAGAALTVTVYKTGTWQAGQYTAISGAHVGVTCGGGFAASGVTGANGKASMSSVPKGMCTINVSKAGCPSNSSGFNMPTYDTNRNVDLNCP